ncbi:hypothetical protein Dsin_018419 [Dipteronia sinensis]|uniref:Peptidase S8/S53 domain-containing protein n=1 Tax=Dipteronia sinensis TaxID=43782 RepID=A0AAE0E1X0_9ROSI|nr:hypothetical protein Dsin_018419 [Dipteronia sinensis]
MEFLTEGLNARDEDGHGSYTASTAAGKFVKDASFYGLAKGTTRGGELQHTKFAISKSSAILSGFDDAIADGVDLLTISIGGNKAYEFKEDPTAIGPFHAIAKGILTVNFAGNNGPKLSSVSSVAPWMFSVAASTHRSPDCGQHYS